MKISKPQEPETLSRWSDARRTKYRELLSAVAALPFGKALEITPETQYGSHDEHRKHRANIRAVLLRNSPGLPLSVYLTENGVGVLRQSLVIEEPVRKKVSKKKKPTARRKRKLR